VLCGHPITATRGTQALGTGRRKTADKTHLAGNDSGHYVCSHGTYRPSKLRLLSGTGRKHWVVQCMWHTMQARVIRLFTVVAVLCLLWCIAADG